MAQKEPMCWKCREKGHNLWDCTKDILDKSKWWMNANKGKKQLSAFDQDEASKEIKDHEEQAENASASAASQ